ncbi:MAG: hypothetical protein G01um101416_88 [Microgenomates group bacterium Gr01-1014_16]|nr:MAG: hypothetical protein G01um101416_88 [Microgenomates group bacterium Gr01-1014_16]
MELNNWLKYYKLNYYYHHYVQEILLHLVPESASVIEFGSKCGETLSRLPNKKKTGVEYSDTFIKAARDTYPKIKFINEHKALHKLRQKFDYIIISHVLTYTTDVQKFVSGLKPLIHKDTRIIVLYFNYLWKPFLDLAQKLNLMAPNTSQPNWLDSNDTDNIFHLESYELLKSGRRFIFPYQIKYISGFFNKFVSVLPFFNSLGLINYSIYRPFPSNSNNYSVSIVIPARNESGNIVGVLDKIPRLVKKQEVIFIEGHSNDDTYKSILKEIKRYKGPMSARVFKQKGNGKGDAVRLGFSKARGEMLMILDADLTVPPQELPKFYSTCASGKGDLVMGSRLIYPMEKLAMRTLNVIGNKVFSLLFTFLLGQRIKDTLCGTKVIVKSNYQKIIANRKHFGDFDPFGDFDLIFGAAKLNLKILEIPIRYRQRSYGKTNISRFEHGLLLLRMVLFAARKVKFI